MTTTAKFRKGQKVVGLGRGSGNGFRPWPSRPTGVVTNVGEGWVRIWWDNSAVEDDMRPEWLEAR